MISGLGEETQEGKIDKPWVIILNKLVRVRLTKMVSFKGHLGTVG